MAAIFGMERRDRFVILDEMEIAQGKTDTQEEEAGIVRRKRRWRTKILGDRKWIRGGIVPLLCLLKQITN